VSRLGASGALFARAGLLAVAALLAVACVNTPATTAREQPLAPADVGLSASAATAPGTPATAWWHALQDPQLDRLIDTALARNPGLASSLARVRIAREQAAIANAGTSPQVTLEGYQYRERFSENYIFPPPYGGGTYWEGRLGFNLDWHLDFWGRQQALVQQARLGAQGVALDAASAELLLSSAVAQAYLELVRAQRLEEVALRAQAQRQSLMQLTAQRVQAGLDTQAELRAAESNLEQSAVDIEQARLAATLARHALAALTGAGAESMQALVQPTLDLEAALPVPDALPADLLARRPDVRAAQARVEAATAGHRAAHANFYPNVDLVAFAGVAAIGLEELFRSGSRQWSVGPAIHLPVFDAGRLKAEYRRSAAEIDAAIATYNESVLRAVREASDQGARLRSLDVQLQAQQRALTAAEQAYSLAKQRYSAGLANQVTVLNAETQVLGARRVRTQLLADRTAARIALLVALGGHFTQEPAR
jgi:NodT family efflux transporter outer membrane factor (OMF) lipoprotein